MSRNLESDNLDLCTIADRLVWELNRLTFAPPITHVYNPLEYALPCYEQYVSLYGAPPKEVVFLGMNPGPWGMAQTGIPFGEVELVREWLGIKAPVSRPSFEHLKRPILGFSCTRREVSGKRVWGWARDTFGTAEAFSSRFFIANYCPLLFFEKDGRNRTPDRLAKQERELLLAVCDAALLHTIEYLAPRHVIAFGRFAHGQATRALTGFPVMVSSVPHPSPANPIANRGWSSLLDSHLKELGISTD